MTRPDTDLFTGDLSLDTTAADLQPGDVVLGYLDDGEFHPMLRGFYQVADITTVNEILVVTEPGPAPQQRRERYLEPDRGVRVAARDPLTRAAARLQSGIVHLEFARACGRRATRRHDFDAVRRAEQRRDAALNAQITAMRDYVDAGGTIADARIHATRFAFPGTLGSP